MSLVADRSVASADRRAGAPQGITLAVAGFLPILTILSLAPAVPSLLQHFSDVPLATTLIPLSVTAPGLMVALLAPFCGIAADRFGRRRLILGATLLYAILGMAPLLFGTLPLMFASRLGVGVVEAIILVIVNTLFADYYDLARRRTWITVQGVTGPILGTASIAIAGALTALQWNGAFYLYALAIPVFLGVLAFCFEPARQHPTPASRPAGDARLPLGLVATYCGFTLFASVIYYVFIVQSGRAFDAIGVESAGNLGLLIGFASLGTPLGAILFYWLSRRGSSEAVLCAMLGLMGLGLIGMGLARSAEAMAIAGFVEQVGGGITVTGLIFWVSRLLPPAARGRGFGYWTTAFFGGQFVSPVIFGAISAVAGGLLASFVVVGVLAILGGVLVIALRRHLPSVHGTAPHA